VRPLHVVARAVMNDGHHPAHERCNDGLAVLDFHVDGVGEQVVLAWLAVRALIADGTSIDGGVAGGENPLGLPYFGKKRARLRIHVFAGVANHRYFQAGGMTAAVVRQADQKRRQAENKAWPKPHHPGDRLLRFGQPADRELDRLAGGECAIDRFEGRPKVAGDE